MGGGDNHILLIFLKTMGAHASDDETCNSDDFHTVFSDDESVDPVWLFGVKIPIGQKRIIKDRMNLLIQFKIFNILKNMNPH